MGHYALVCGGELFDHGAMSDRLTKPHWIKHGLKALTKEGPGALRIGRMAAALNVSRGSFYWHFRDAADFRAHLLQGWQERTTDQILKEIESGGAKADPLKHFIGRILGEQQPLDRAIRSWAAEDREVAKVMGAVDRKRIDHIAEMLVKMGVERARAPGRALFIYCAYLGQGVVADPNHSILPAPVVADISGLFVA